MGASNVLGAFGSITSLLPGSSKGAQNVQGAPGTQGSGQTNNGGLLSQLLPPVLKGVMDKLF